MNPYDAAHSLAKSLSESIEFKQFKKAKDELEKDPKAKEMFSDFRKKQFEVEALKLSGKSTEKASKDLKNLFEIISYNTLITNFLEAEQRFATLMYDIQNIIAKAVDLELDLDQNNIKNDQ